MYQRRQMAIKEKRSKHLVLGEGEHLIKSNSSYIFTQMTGTPYLNYKFEAISRGASLNSAYNQSNEKELHDNHMNHISVAPT